MTFLCLACASAAYASSEPTKTDEHVQAAPDATQSQTPGAYQFVDPKAISAMRSFFGQPGMGLTSDKAILSLAAGNPVADLRVSDPWPPCCTTEPLTTPAGGAP